MRTAWQQEGEEKAVTSPMSLVISAFAPVVDVTKTLTPQLKADAGDTELLLIDLGAGRNRLGGSILTQVYGQMGDTPADVDSPERLKNFFNAIQQANQKALILAYHDRSDGGLFATLAEMAFAGRAGLSVNLDGLGDNPFDILFNEELGAVIQIASENREAVLGLLEDCGLKDYSHLIGSPAADERLSFMYQGKTVYKTSRLHLQRLWSETSFRIQSLRDNPSCAQQEMDTLLNDNPGLSAATSFDVNEDITAPYINLARPRIAVLREQGVNSQVEMAAAFDRARFDAVDVHMSDILTGRTALTEFKGLVACGGFSYGDVLGAGEGWAKTILFNSLARDQFEAFFHRPDTFTLGICNGCQMVSNLKALIPGADNWPRFVRNLSEQFEARFSLVRIEESPSVLLKDMVGTHMPIAVAHGEGRAEFASTDALTDVVNSNMVAMRFIDNHLAVTETYPANPNGSPQGITGLSSADGRVTIMMPHPERVFRAATNSWHPSSWTGDSGWMRLFRNARVFVD